MADEWQGYVDLGLSCAEIYKTLKRGTNRRELDEPSDSVREAIDKLTTWVEPVEHLLFSRSP